MTCEMVSKNALKSIWGVIYTIFVNKRRKFVIFLAGLIFDHFLGIPHEVSKKWFYTVFRNKMGIFIVILTGFLADRFIRDFHTKWHKSCLNKNALKSIWGVIYIVFVNKRRKFVIFFGRSHFWSFPGYTPRGIKKVVLHCF